MAVVLRIGGLLSSGIKGGSGALTLLGNEWDGLALDFVTDTYASRVSTGSEKLLAAGIASIEPSVAIDFTDNSYAIGA